MIETLASVDLDWLIILGAGIAAGLINGVVGSGTLVSFPTLLLLGYPPLVANVSNNIGLIPGSVAAAYQYRRVIAEARAHLRRMAPVSVLGALVGSVLLIVLPGSVFQTVVPVLIGVALLLVVAQPIVQPMIATRLSREQGKGEERKGVDERVGIPLLIIIGLLGVYGGYFGAAQGILLIVTLALAFRRPFAEANGLKNLLTAIVNLVAALVFVVLGLDSVDWGAVAGIAIGSTIGGTVGARAAKRLPQPVYRGVILVVGAIALWTTLMP